MILPICFAGGREEVGLREVSLHRLQRRPRPDQRQHQRRRGAVPGRGRRQLRGLGCQEPSGLPGWLGENAGKNHLV